MVFEYKANFKALGCLKCKLPLDTAEHAYDFKRGGEMSFLVVVFLKNKDTKNFTQNRSENESLEQAIMPLFLSTPPMDPWVGKMTDVSRQGAAPTRTLCSRMPLKSGRGQQWHDIANTRCTVSTILAVSISTILQLSIHHTSHGE